MSQNLPQNIEAERSVLGAMLQSAQAIREVTGVLKPEDFFLPQHGLIYSAILRLAQEGVPPDRSLSVGQLLTKRGQIMRIGGMPYLFELYQLVHFPANALYYAMPVKETARLRRVVQHAQRILQHAHAAVDDGPEGHLAQLSSIAKESLAIDLLVDEADYEGPVPGLSTWDAFLNEPDRPSDWLVEDLIEVADVMMFLAGEGAGKSWLTRQLMLCIAAGVHPFYPNRRIAPKRTLLVDLENAPNSLRRQSRHMNTQILRLAGREPDPDMRHVWRKEDGLNLRQPEQAKLLERVISETRPQVVGFGSLYKAYQRGTSDWDTAASEVREVLDRLRRRYGIAFILEHHMPKGDRHGRPQTPLGSSEWMRWVTHGRILTKIGSNAWELLQTETFRLDRDPRDIPPGLHRGGVLPWSPIWDPADLEFAREK